MSKTKKKKQHPGDSFGKYFEKIGIQKTQGP